MTSLTTCTNRCVTCARAQVCGSYAVPFTPVHTRAPTCHAGSPKRPKTSCRAREARQRVHLQASNQPNLPRCQSNVRAQRFHSGLQRTLHLTSPSGLNHVAGPRVCTLACQARPSSEWKSCTSMHSQHTQHSGGRDQLQNTACLMLLLLFRQCAGVKSNDVRSKQSAPSSQPWLGSKCLTLMVHAPLDSATAVCA